MEAQTDMECWSFHSYLDKMAELSATLAGPFCSQGNLLVLISVRGLLDPRATEWRAAELGFLKICKKLTGIRNRDLPFYGAVPQPTAPPVPV